MVQTIVTELSAVQTSELESAVAEELLIPDPQSTSEEENTDETKDN